MSYRALLPHEVHLSPQGRIVIPAQLRRELGFEPGATLITRVEDGRLVLEKRDNVLRRLRRRFARVDEGVSLAEELIADRRREAAGEEQDVEPRGTVPEPSPDHGD